MESDLLLVKSGNLSLQVVNLVNVGLLVLQVVFFKVGNVLNNFLQNVVGGLSSVMLQSCALTSQELNVLLVLVQLFEGGF